MIRYLRPEPLLFISPWRPVVHDTTAFEGRKWECPTCMEARTYFRELARLEGAPMQFMLQCPTCDHLAVVRLEADADPPLATEYGGPHIEQFIAFLDARSRREELEM
jgi:hypothetical protein